MFRKQKIQLITLIYAPIGFFVPITLEILFPKTIFAFMIVASAIFGLFYLLIFFLPIGGWPIGGKEAKPKYSLVQWILATFIIEISALAIFLIQNNVILEHFAPNTSFDISTYIPVFISSSFLNSILFPWTLIAVVGASFAYLSYTKDFVSPFSIRFPHRWPTVFISNEIRRIIDIYINQSTRLFLIINLIALTFVLCQYFETALNFINPFNSLVAAWAMFFVYLNKRFKKTLYRIEDNQLAQGLQFLLLWVLMIVFLLLAQGLIHVLINQSSNLKEVIQNTYPFAFPNLFMNRILFNWCWWLLGIPLISSLLIKTAHGYSIRSFLGITLLLPVLLIIFYFVSGKILIETWLSTQFIYYFAAILSLGSLLYLLTNKESTLWIWFGFYPIKTPAKIYRTPLAPFWVPAIVIFGLTLFLGMIAILWIGITQALPALLIYYLCFCYRKN